MANMIVQPAVGWEEANCAACGKATADFVEIHLRHNATKIVLCVECDEEQLSRPRMTKVRTSRA